MARRRRRRNRYSGNKLADFFNHNSSEGLEIHRLNEVREVSKRSHYINVFDGDHVVIELGGSGKGFHHVSVVKQIRKINAERARSINRYVSLINGGK